MHYGIAIAAALWVPLHLLVDGRDGAAVRAAGHAGANVLMAYVLAPLIFYLFTVLGIEWYARLGREPATGIARSLVYSAIVLSFCAVLDRFRVRLRV